MSFVYPTNMTWETTLEDVAAVQTDPEIKAMIEEHIAQVTADMLELAALMRAEAEAKAKTDK